MAKPSGRKGARRKPSRAAGSTGTAAIPTGPTCAASAGREDVESPGKKWTRMDVICDGDRITIQVNGVVVNKGFDAKPSAGLIQVQTEGAELYVRRFELWPLGKAPAFNAAELQQ